MPQPVNSTASAPERSRACKFAFSADDHSVNSGLSFFAALRQRASASGSLGACARGSSPPEQPQSSVVAVINLNHGRVEANIALNRNRPRATLKVVNPEAGIWT